MFLAACIPIVLIVSISDRQVTRSEDIICDVSLANQRQTIWSMHLTNWGFGLANKSEMSKLEHVFKRPRAC